MNYVTFFVGVSLSVEKQSREKMALHAFPRLLHNSLIDIAYLEKNFDS